MKLFIKGLLKIFGVKVVKAVEPVAVTTSRTTAKVATSTAKITTDIALGFTAEFLTGIDKAKKELETSDDIKRIKEDWAYIIGKSDKPSAKTSRRNTRPSIQSQRLMNRF